MARKIDNAFVDGAGNGATGKTRTHLWANPANVIKLAGIEKVGGCTYTADYTYLGVSAGASLTLTPTVGHLTAGLRYFHFTIRDQDGTEVSGAVDIVTPVAISINTSTLDKLKSWKIIFDAGITFNGMTCRDGWELVLPAGSIADNPSGTGSNT